MKPLFKIITPRILFHRKTEEGFDCGPFISNLDTGIYFSKYDYGYVFQISFLGVGINITWTTLDIRL